ncbi:hypothetical protein CRG98_043247 [Punica granatum]|uniref:GB1/RHD3-type G domain-containing protein n=1 Tax=Punica granatum TaxID=22663 RepID=A0A2I0HXL3_PUNGR|nr:hypothetical protein CRG98_043247 [Punica granatum]
MEQENIHLEQKYLSEFKRFEELQERCRNAEKEAKRATELADKARAEAVGVQKEKSEIQRLAMERLAQIERAERLIDSLERDKTELADKLKEARLSDHEAQSRIALLEARVEEREKEIESLLDKNNEQRASTVKVLQSLLDNERKACAEAISRVDDLSVQLQSAHAKIDLLQQELTSVRLNETALDSKLKTASLRKRTRVEDAEVGMDSVQDMDVDKTYRGSKRTRSTTSPRQFTQPEDGGSSYRAGEDDDNGHQAAQEDYTKFTREARLGSQIRDPLESMRRLFNRGRDASSSSSDAPSPASPYLPSPSSSPTPTSVTGPARPIRLVYCDEKGKFRMDPEAVAVLQLVKQPIGIVSVCGRARQGKSFILNQLLGRSSGFQVASTHRPCTKGLWLWSAPLKRTALDGTEYNLLLLDSEGIDAYDQTVGFFFLYLIDVTNNVILSILNV